MMAQTLETTEVLEALGGTVTDLKEFVKNHELDEEEIEQLIESEKQLEDRKTAKEFLEKQLHDSEKDDAVETAKTDVEEIKEAVENIQELEDVSPVEESEKLDRDQVLHAIGGTARNLKDTVERHSLGKEELEKLLEAEKILKDRKEVKDFLEYKISERELSEDLAKAEGDLDELEQDIEDIDEDSELGKAMGEIAEEDEDKGLADAMEEIAEEEIDKDVEEELDEVFGEEDGKEDTRDNTEEELDELGEAVKEDELEEDGKAVGTAETPEEPEEVEETGYTDEPEEESEDIEELKEQVQETEEQDEDEPEKEGEENEEEDEAEEEDERSRFEKKMDIVDDLGVDIEREQIKKMSLEELKRLKQDKEERDQLIEELQDEFDDEILRKASIEDLRKIKAGMENSSSESEDVETEDNTEDEEEEDEKEVEELEEEAEEDLKMLMGAVGEKDGGDEDDGQSFKEQLDGIKNQVRGILNHGGGSDGDSKGMRKDKVLELLDDYSSQDPQEGAIKTAHIMKGYLEYSYEIERELTYKELADELEDKNMEGMDELRDFFRNLHKSEYSGSVEELNLESVIEVSKKIVKKVG